jgi:hypothetical protein
MRRVAVHEEEAVTEAGDTSPYRATWHWILTRDRVGNLEVLTVSTPGGETLLPVFTSAEDACVYFSGRGSDWKTRKTARGELVSILMGVCREARWVALDPPPSLSTEETLRLLSLSRESFLEPLLGRGRFWFEEQPKAQRSRTRGTGPRSRVALKIAVDAMNAL